MSITTNTRLAYLYRDADNYKVRHEVVFAGQMSEDEKMRIIASLEAGEYFFPGPLGLNDERFGSETEADHPFFEFCYFEETPDKPTTDISIAEIVKRFEDNAHLWKAYEDSTGDVELKEDSDVGLAASEAKDDLSPRTKALLFETLELFRKEIGPKFSDWKDADDWLFSSLSITKDELQAIYAGHDVLVYRESAAD
jgi:hypothetical protein